MREELQTFWAMDLYGTSIQLAMVLDSSLETYLHVGFVAILDLFFEQ